VRVPLSTQLSSPPVHKNHFAARAGQVTLPDTMGGASWEKQDAAAGSPGERLREGLLAAKQRPGARPLCRQLHDALPAKVKSALLGNYQQLRPLPHGKNSTVHPPQ
jgi:hypothetical protein